MAPSTPAMVPAGALSAEVIEELHDLLMAQYDMSLYERRIFLKTVELLPKTVTHREGSAVFEPVFIDARQIIADSNLKGDSALTEL